MSPKRTPSIIPDKLYFRVGEVGRIVGVAPYVLRFWEKEFERISPKRSPSGQRMYRRSEVELLLQIKHLLYERKYTIPGARQYLQSAGLNRPKQCDQTALLTDIREALEEIREILKPDR